MTKSSSTQRVDGFRKGIEMQKRDSEIQRFQMFMDSWKELKPYWKNLLEPSHKYYQNKLRELMVREGLNPHPHSEERIDYV